MITNGNDLIIGQNSSFAVSNRTKPYSRSEHYPNESLLTF